MHCAVSAQNHERIRSAKARRVHAEGSLLPVLSSVAAKAGRSTLRPVGSGRFGHSRAFLQGALDHRHHQFQLLAVEGEMRGEAQ